MRWLRFLVLGVLICLGAAFAAGNVYFAAARSTIPLRLDAAVEQKELRHEKHPPRDDVYLLDLGSRGMIQVDKSIYDQVAVGDRLEKERGSRALSVSGQPIALEWSPEAIGMAWAMPLTLLVLIASALYVGRAKTEDQSD